MSNTKYKLEDLKEGRILVFENGDYGIITSQNPIAEFYNTKELACVYNNGECDELKDVINLDFTLYEGEHPLCDFLGLMNNGINWSITYQQLKLIKKDIIKYNFKKVLYFNNKEYNVRFRIRGRRTTAKLEDGTKGSVYCNIDNIYDENEGINRAFKKALSNQLLKEVNK